MSLLQRTLWDSLLTQARLAHQSTPEMEAFCPFPDDLEPCDVVPFMVPPGALMAADRGLHTTRYKSLRDAFIDAGPQAHWRETYKETDIGADFMQRFGCYCLIGEGGAFTSLLMRAWVVYMPANLYYTWHHHPAEEMYLTLAGSAEFFRKGEPSVRLASGGTSFHASNQAHAMQTHESPVMAYVVWRNGFETPPALTV